MNMPADTSFNQPHGWKSFERLLNFWLLLVAVGGLLSPTLALSPSRVLLDGGFVDVYVDGVATDLYEVTCQLLPYT